MRPRIIVNKHTPYAEQIFQTIGDVTALASSEITNDSVRDADVLVVRSETKVSKELLEGSSVRFVGTVTIGTDHIDQQYLQERSIQSANAAGSNANSVAEYILAALLVLCHKKNIILADKVLGVVGVGNIGSKVVKIAEGLGMKVLQCDPPLARATNDARFVSFDDVLNADIITFHVPLTKSGPDATNHMVNDDTISKMKRNAMIINSSRGGVIETNSLIDALNNKHISEAVLDVWEKEPNINIDLLSRVMIGTPHIAGYSLDGKLNAVQMIYEAVCKFLSITPLKNVRDFLPNMEIQNIKIENGDGSKEETLNSIINQAYDILYDDNNLRKIIELNENERANYFSKLRSGYRERKEFSHYKINLPDSKKYLKSILQVVQFNV